MTTPSSTHHSMPEPIIAVQRVGKQVRDSTGTLTILHDIDFTLEAREAAAIVGASGSARARCSRSSPGWTRRPRHGARGRHRPVRARRGRAGRGACRAHGLRVPELPAARQPDRARERDAAAGVAGPPAMPAPGPPRCCAGSVRRAPVALSAGAVRRRAAASRWRARFVVEPAVLLADEPTGSPDFATGATVMELMFELNRSPARRSCS